MKYGSTVMRSAFFGRVLFDRPSRQVENLIVAYQLCPFYTSDSLPPFINQLALMIKQRWPQSRLEPAPEVVKALKPGQGQGVQGPVLARQLDVLRHSFFSVRYPEQGPYKS